jgi:hypothetical protein
MYEPSGKIIRGRCIEEEECGCDGGGTGVAIEDATSFFLLSVLLLMVEEEAANELSPEIVLLVETEELVESVTDIVELTRDTK